jgi:hypothetical protein
MEPGFSVTAPFVPDKRFSASMGAQQTACLLVKLLKSWLQAKIRLQSELDEERTVVT